MLEAKTTFDGQCHCGAVRFIATTDLGGMGDCNCSRCRRLGVIWQSVPAANFTVTSGEETLKTYRFNTHRIQHLFCPDCGIESFARGSDKDGSPTFMLNVNCLEGAPPVDRNAITHWDGASW